MTTIPPVCAGADIIVGLGEIESDQVLVLEQLVVDNELVHFCEMTYTRISPRLGREEIS
ncbi:MAG: hypothetical protein WC832_00795 [Anaerolineales bacterium]